MEIAFQPLLDLRKGWNINKVNGLRT